MLINLVFLLSVYFERDQTSTRNPDIYVNLLVVRKRKKKNNPQHFGVYRSTVHCIKHWVCVVETSEKHFHLST